MDTTHDPTRDTPPSYLLAMPLHAITEIYGEAGLRHRWALELHRLPPADRTTLSDALAWASQLHAGQRRVREPYVNHLLRVALRILCYYHVTDVHVLTAALLHDSVEDQPWAMTGQPTGSGAPPRAEAFDALTNRFGATVTRLVAAVTNPLPDPARDADVQYREHLTAALAVEPWARVIKLSDFTDNGVGVIHTTGPKPHRAATKYTPVLPLLRALLDLPDTPLQPHVKDHITDQLHLAQTRFTTILTA